MKVFAILCTATMAYATVDFGQTFRGLQHPAASGYGPSHQPSPVYGAPPLLNSPNGLFGSNPVQGLLSYKRNLFSGLTSQLSNSPLAQSFSSASASSSSNGLGLLNHNLFNGPPKPTPGPVYLPSEPSHAAPAHHVPEPAPVYEHPVGSHLAPAPHVPLPAPHVPVPAPHVPVPAPVYGPPELSHPAPANNFVTGRAPVPAPVYGPPHALPSAPVYKPVSPPVYRKPEFSHVAPSHNPSTVRVPVPAPVYGPPKVSHPAPAHSLPSRPVPSEIYGAPRVTLPLANHNSLPTYRPAPSPAYGLPNFNQVPNQAPFASGNSQGPSAQLQLPILPAGTFRPDTQPAPSASLVSHSEFQPPLTKYEGVSNFLVATPSVEQGFIPTTNFQGQVAPQEELIQKHVYVHAPPPEFEQPSSTYVHSNVDQTPKKHYKIVFIKAPTSESRPNYVQQVAPQIEEKTLIYVLVNKDDEHQQVALPAPAPAEPSKPEVYFIKYKKQPGEQGPFVPAGLENADLSAEHEQQLACLQEQMQQALTSGSNEIVASQAQINALIEAQGYYDTPSQEQVDAYSKAQQEAIARNRALAKLEAQATTNEDAVRAKPVSAPYEY